MFRFHCECCGTHRLALYYLRPANAPADTTMAIFQETQAAITPDVEKLARPQVFAAFGGNIPFFCLDCGYVSTTPLQPMHNKEHLARLTRLRPALTVVN